MLLNDIELYWSLCRPWLHKSEADAHMEPLTPESASPAMLKSAEIEHLQIESWEKSMKVKDLQLRRWSFQFVSSFHLQNWFLSSTFRTQTFAMEVKMEFSSFKAVFWAKKSQTRPCLCFHALENDTIGWKTGQTRFCKWLHVRLWQKAVKSSPVSRAHQESHHLIQVYDDSQFMQCPQKCNSLSWAGSALAGASQSLQSPAVS